MDKLYRTHRIHFSLHFCRELEFMINMCLYQVRAIKSDSLNGGEELEGRGSRCMAEHMRSCGNYTFSDLNATNRISQIQRKMLKSELLQVFHVQVQRFYWTTFLSKYLYWSFIYILFNCILSLLSVHWLILQRWWLYCLLSPWAGGVGAQWRAKSTSQWWYQH